MRARQDEDNDEATDRPLIDTSGWDPGKDEAEDGLSDCETVFACPDYDDDGSTFAGKRRAWSLKVTCWTVRAGGGAVCSTFKKRTTGKDQLPQPGQLNSCLEMVKAENS